MTDFEIENFWRKMRTTLEEFGLVLKKVKNLKEITFLKNMTCFMKVIRFVKSIKIEKNYHSWGIQFLKNNTIFEEKYNFFK